MNKTWIKRALAGACAATLLVTGCGARLQVSNSGSNQGETTVLKDNQSERYKEIEDKLSEIDDLLDKYYLNDDEIDTQTMEDSIMKGYVSGLGEKYTAYYTADEFNALKESTSGEYKGIGVMVSQNIDTKTITVIRVFKDNPGYKAGLKAGDILYKVNDEDITGKDVDLVVSKIKGEEGTEVKLTVYRPDTEEYIDMTMKRESIKEPTVEYEMKEDNIGYVAISSFEEVTEDQFNAALEDLISQGMEGLVVDLRNNPGGVLDTVCNMLDRILPKDKLLVYTIDKNDNKQEIVSKNEDTLDMPIAVVVNGNSASASEVFTGALKDYGKAVIVGETTFGKGIVQTIIPLSDGSALKMTTSRYYTPNGTCIHGIGIVPDIQIAADGTMITDDSSTDESTDASKETESSDKTSKDSSDTSKDQSSAESETSSGEALAIDSSESKVSSDDSIDYQLNAAIDAVKAQLK